MKRRAFLPLVVGAPLVAQSVLPEKSQVGMIGFATDHQSDRLKAAWLKIPETRRSLIESHLLTGLGLSSTGVIQLTSVTSADVTSKQASQLLQFQQIDLFGDRLFWIVLIDPDALTRRILYDADQRKIESKQVPFAGK